MYVLSSCTKNSAMFDFEVFMYIIQQESKEVIRLNHLQACQLGKTDVHHIDQRVKYLNAEN